MKSLPPAFIIGRKPSPAWVVFIFFLLCTGMPIWTSPNGAVIQRGHMASVTSLRHDEKRQLLFSASEDGTVKIWRTSAGSDGDGQPGVLLHDIRISHLPVSEIAFHPQKPYVAALVVRSSGVSGLGVWNWEKGDMLYEIRMETVPLFFSFSPAGSYLIHTMPEWQSLKFHDAESGKAADIMQ